MRRIQRHIDTAPSRSRLSQTFRYGAASVSERLAAGKGDVLMRLGMVLADGILARAPLGETARGIQRHINTAPSRSRLSQTFRYGAARVSERLSAGKGDVLMLPGRVLADGTFAFAPLGETARGIQRHINTAPSRSRLGQTFRYGAARVSERLSVKGTF